MAPVAAAVAVAVGVALVAGGARAGDKGPFLLLVACVVAVLAVAAYARPAFAVVGVLLAFPVGSTALPGGLLKVVQATAFAMAGIVVLRRIAAARTPLPWSPPLWWALGLLGWTLVSLTTALDTTLAIKQIAALLGGIVFSTVVLAACRSVNELRRVLLVFVVACAATAGWALAHAGTLHSAYGGTIAQNRLHGTFSHPNDLASFCVMAALVAIGMALLPKSRTERVLATLSALLLIVALTLSLARGGWIGLVVGVGYLLVTVPEARRAMLALLATVAVAVAFGANFLGSGSTNVQVVTQRLTAINKVSPYDNRKQIWAEAIREIKQSPLTGYGAGNFVVSSIRPESTTVQVYAEHAHDIWLTWAAEVGIPGTVFIAGLAWALARSISGARRAALTRGDLSEHALVAGVGAALLSVLGQGLVDYTMRNAVILLEVWMLVGAVLVVRHEAARAAGAAASPSAPSAPRYDRALVEPRLHGAEERVASQVDALRARRHRLGDLADALRRRERELEQREAAVEARAGEIDAGRSHVLEDREIDVQGRQLDDGKAKLDLRAREIEERAAQLAARTAEIDTRAGEIVRQAGQLDERAAKLELRIAEIENRATEIDEQARQLEERAAQLDIHSAEVEGRAAELARRERMLDFRAVGLAERERAVAPPAAPTASIPVEAERPAVVAPPPPRPAPVKPQPTAPAPSSGALTLDRLERLIESRLARFPEREDEWKFTLLYLSEYADYDGRLPSQFDGLISDVYAELL
jgi:O-antigen ligase